MSWVYLSPHFDDVALSCGGLVWEQVQAGEQVSIWTICAGDTPHGELSSFAQQLHTRWEIEQNAPHWRRYEDLTSCQRLGAGQRYFTVPDCIYRVDPMKGEPMYASEEALNGSLQPGDKMTVQALRKELKGLVTPEDRLVCPLALGKHVDHQMTRAATEGLALSLWYYADFPYVLKHPEELERIQTDGWVSQVYTITPPGLSAWQDSVAAHASQIGTFWVSEAAMHQALWDYLHWDDGIRLWRRPVV